MSKITAFLLAIALSVITVLADYFIKEASLKTSVWSKALLVGSLIYGLTGLGWVFVTRHMKLSTLGVVYGVSCISLLVLVSVFTFNEKITTIEIFGIILGMSSIIILYRFA
ncbi:MAG: transporter [Candidatus Moranbacteria bacterium]|nr:transporter [Candidatus Moranbacteria bacterium]